MIRCLVHALLAMGPLALALACGGAHTPPQPLLGAQVGSDLGFGPVVEATPERLVARRPGSIKSGPDMYQVRQTFPTTLTSMGFTARRCVGEVMGVCWRFQRGEETLEGKMVDGPPGMYDLVLTPAVPYAPQPIPPGAPWDDLSTEIGPGLFAEARTCMIIRLEGGTDSSMLTFAPDGTATTSTSSDAGRSEFAGRWRIEGQRLVVRGRWSPAVRVPEEACEEEGCVPTPAHDVADDGVTLEMGQVWYRKGAAWIDLSRSPGSQRILLTCGTHAHQDILVMDGGGGPEAVAAVAQVVAAAQGGPKTLVRPGGRTDNPRQDVEIIRKLAGHDPLFDVLQTALERDIPGIRISEKYWSAAPASWVIAVGPVPGR